MNAVCLISSDVHQIRVDSLYHAYQSSKEI